MYYLGIDLGSSSTKLALVACASGNAIGVVHEPEKEMAIHAPQPGWAEQHPDDWWHWVCKGIQKVTKEYGITSKDIKGIGISYQMHGLVVVDEKGASLRPSIIWCDSRAVAIGNMAYEAIGEDFCTTRLLNSPGNFTASKLRWVKENEPAVYKRIYKFLLPGDYIAYRLSGVMNTTIPGLSEGIFWDFQSDAISSTLMDYFQIDPALAPDPVDTFSEQAQVSAQGARESGLMEGTPILYRAGDQPNNALSLNVLHPGEIAGTGGTSGVMYAVTENHRVKECARVNHFAHVNYQIGQKKRIGKLLCVNGAGIMYRWLRQNLSVGSYEEMNQLANTVEIGADGVCLLPFGNGAERILYNRDIGARILHLNLNRHTTSHLCRAALEGIAFSFLYGFEMMRSDGIEAKVIRAGNDNLFRSEIFASAIATLIGKEIEIYNTTGAIGAARACALTDHDFSRLSNFMRNDHVKTYTPAKDTSAYQQAYQNWKKELEQIINH